MHKPRMSPLDPVHNVKEYKRVQGIHQIEHFFRAAASLEIDKEDIRRYYDFVDKKIVDLLLVAQHTAKANGRVAVEIRDLPIAKGLQESIQAFRVLDTDVGLERILESAIPEPRSDLPFSPEVERRLPEIAGGINFCGAGSLLIFHTISNNTPPEKQGTAFHIYSLL